MVDIVPTHPRPDAAIHALVLDGNFDNLKFRLGGAMRWPLPALVLLSTLLEGSEAFSVAVFANPSVFTYAGVQESQALHSCPLKSPLAHRSICPRRPEGVTQSRGSLAKNAAKLRMSTSDNELTTVLRSSRFPRTGKPVVQRLNCATREQHRDQGRTRCGGAHERETRCGCH